MANDVAAYNPVFYANETLIHLRNALGLAGRVHRGYERERNQTFNRGDTVKIKKPSTFTAQAAPGSVQDIDTDELSLVVNQWKEVRFAVADDDWAFGGDAVINDHIIPAAYAIANDLDQYLASLYKNVPYIYDYGTATDHQVITGMQKILFDNGVPMDDDRMHLMVDGTLRQGFQNSTFFHSQQVAGPAANETLLRGSLGMRLGVEIFANQNTPTHTPGTAAGGGDTAGLLNGAVAKGATSIIVDNFTGSETVLAGDTMVIAGSTQRYAATATTTFSTGAGTINITPAAVQAYADDAAVTIGAQTATAHTQQLMFHRNFMALAVVPLPDTMSDIRVFTAVDPQSGLSVRARQWTDADNSRQQVCLDVLYGGKVLDGNMAVRGWT